MLLLIIIDFSVSNYTLSNTNNGWIVVVLLPGRVGWGWHCHYSDMGCCQGFMGVGVGLSVGVFFVVAVRF